MLNYKLVVRSALTALFLLTLLTTYPVLSTQGTVYAQSADPVAETPTPQPENPAFNFVKLVNNQNSVEVELGAPLTFRYEVANTGNVTLTWSSLVDDVFGDLSAQCGLPRDVSIGTVEACEITVNAESAPDGLVNIGTATIIGLDPQQDQAAYITPAEPETPTPTPPFDRPDPDAPPVPIPEPITIVLFGTGLAALSAAAAARRRQD